MTTTTETPVDKSQARVRRMFGEIAGSYDFLNHLLSLNIDRYWRWRTVRKVPPRDVAAPMLDLCTGTGDLAIAYFKKAQGRMEVVGADFCLPMLAIARQKAARLAEKNRDAAERLSFVEADAMELPFANDTYQIVSVAFGLRNIADTDQGLEEMVRVCQPGGRVAVLEFSTPSWQPFKAIYQWYFRHVLPKIGQLFSRSAENAYSYLPSSVGQFPCGAALAARLEAAGLRNVTYHPLTFGIATLYVGTK